MSCALTPIVVRLRHLGRMLRSPAYGEVVAAARVINRMLKVAGSDIPALAARIEHDQGASA